MASPVLVSVLSLVSCIDVGEGSTDSPFTSGSGNGVGVGVFVGDGFGVDVAVGSGLYAPA